MSQNVILEYYNAFTCFGDLSKTLASVYKGNSGIRTCFFDNVETSIAPFQNIEMRSLENAVQWLKAKVPYDKISFEKTLLIFTAAKGDLEYFYNKKSKTKPLLDFQASYCNQILFNNRLPYIVISTACTSGVVALETAWEVLTNDDFRQIIIIGFDFISPFVVQGFNSLQALSKTGARPFDQERDGLTLGETITIAILRCKDSPCDNLIIRSAVSTNDANHRTGPSRTGEGLFSAAKQALKIADLTTEDIGFVKFHGTATPYNDAMEAKAMKNLFQEKIPPCFSFKGAIGHTSGAGALTELLLVGKILEQEIIPPTVGFQNLGVDEQLPISSKVQAYLPHKKSALCLSAGFGGLNTAVVVSKGN